MLYSLIVIYLLIGCNFTFFFNIKESEIMSPEGLITIKFITPILFWPLCLLVLIAEIIKNLLK